MPQIQQSVLSQFNVPFPHPSPSYLVWAIPFGRFLCALKPLLLATKDFLFLSEFSRNPYYRFHLDSKIFINMVNLDFTFLMGIKNSVRGPVSKNPAQYLNTYSQCSSGTWNPNVKFSLLSLWPLLKYSFAGLLPLRNPVSSCSGWFDVLRMLVQQDSVVFYWHPASHTFKRKEK